MKLGAYWHGSQAEEPHSTAHGHYLEGRRDDGSFYSLPVPHDHKNGHRAHEHADDEESVMRKLKLDLDEIDLPQTLNLWCKSCQAMHLFLRGKGKTFYWGPECGQRTGVLQLVTEGIIIEGKWRKKRRV